MTNINRHEYDILLDMSLGLTGEQQNKEAGHLLSCDSQAKAVKTNLDNIRDALHEWPDEQPSPSLMEQTMELVSQYEQSRSMARSSEVIARTKVSGTSGEVKERVSWILGNLRDLITVAACLLLAFTFLQPMTQYGRDQARRIQCADNLRQIQAGMVQYAQDNQGFLPFIQRENGQPWWTVGKQSPDNNSNTRNIFLLVKGQYVPAKMFVCPGSENQPNIRIELDKQTLKMLHDFAGRDQVHLSFRLIRKNDRLDIGHKILASDQNPLFAEFDPERDSELDLAKNPKLLQKNSPNHAGQGQNLLFNDGHIDFSETRWIGPKLDDIFTIKSTTRYTGTELPGDDDDFAAP